MTTTLRLSWTGLAKIGWFSGIRSLKGIPFLSTTGSGLQVGHLGWRSLGGAFNFSLPTTPSRSQKKSVNPAKSDGQPAETVVKLAGMKGNDGPTN